MLARDGKILDCFMWWSHKDLYEYLCEKHANLVDEFIEKMKKEN